MSIYNACAQCAFCQSFTNVRLHRTDWLMVDHDSLLPEVGPLEIPICALCDAQSTAGNLGALEEALRRALDADDQATVEHDVASRALRDWDIREFVSVITSLLSSGT